MGDLKRVGMTFRSVFMKEDGSHFKGNLLKPSMSQTRNTAFFNARRILKVDENQDVNTGDVFRLDNGKWGLCFDNAEGYYEDMIYRTYGVIVLNKEFPWKRRITEIDPVTQLSKTVGYEELGLLKCAFEFVSYENDSLKIPQPKYRLLCGADIRPMDVLDNNGTLITVQNVEGVMGVKLAYVRD